MHLHDPLLELRPVPGHGVQLGPDLRVASRQVLVDVAHRGAPFFDERDFGGVEGALAVEQSFRVALHRLEEQLLDRAEVVVDESVVDARRGRHLPGRDPGVPLLDQQPLGGVEQCLSRDLAGRDGLGGHKLSHMT